MRSFLIAALIGFTVAGGPFHLFAIVSDWVNDRRYDVRAGLRKNWWSKYQYTPITVQQLAELYQRTNTVVRTAMLEMPADRWFRPYPSESE